MPVAGGVGPGSGGPAPGSAVWQPDAFPAAPAAAASSCSTDTAATPFAHRASHSCSPPSSPAHPQPHLVLSKIIEPYRKLCNMFHRPMTHRLIATQRLQECLPSPAQPQMHLNLDWRLRGMQPFCGWLSLWHLGPEHRQ